MRYLARLKGAKKVGDLGHGLVGRVSSGCPVKSVPVHDGCSGRSASAFVLRAKAQYSAIKVWDHAVVVVVVCVHEAGGQVTDLEGYKLGLTADRADRRIIYPSGGVLVANSSLHKELLQIISG
ncbi:Putative PAP-specific phosphatase, mitochondrial [Apostasia shenzhenica]|uniref:PAP-specific phosphatase, mitochondrial n=1 Tax=Apostasia shenzhenica TaxID=1088818 RepID=A0A2H9ZQX7_9ASPA|nr:Putative PAP-specific phosphatase, mitochondrial [Apostasia shenzhenica]